MKNRATIHFAEDPAAVPLGLLLAADPSLESIQQYLLTDETLVAKNGAGEIIGACILVPEDGAMNIKNISVLKKYQGTGIGKQLLEAAKARCRAAGVRTLCVGTGNSSLGQLAFYQKCGFEMTKIIRGYFLDNYPAPIFEHGLQCKHQIILTCDLFDV